MGSGVAKAIRNKWPKVYQTYSQLQPSSDLLGTAQIICVDSKLPLYVCNCFTQYDYGYDGGAYADVQSIYQSLERVCYWLSMNKRQLFGEHDQVNLYIPQIGCGRGGLQWDRDVKPLVDQLEHKWSDSVIFNVCTL